MTASASRADGDPASDYLLTENVDLPYRSPSPAVSRGLRRAADDVYARGDRVKVALIYSVDDLGAIPSLFGDRETTRSSSESSSGSGTSGHCSS
jgi:hypothetical protein